MAAITDITFAMGPSKDVPAPNKYTKVDQDLNEGAGGKYIYLCYTTKGSESPITGLYLLDGVENQPPSGYYKCPLDLNQGAGGHYIFLCWTRSAEAGSPITDITFAVGKNASAPDGYTKLDKDLNKGAGGKYIYLCYK